MERYKDARYSGAAGWARWTGDLFTGLPEEADQIFERAKALYEQKMTTVISGVADLIGRELDAAKAKIAAGRQEIKNFVATQPKELQKLANDAAGEMNGKFDQLESDVDAKQESLVDDLAQKYVEARNAVDEEIKAEQAKNTGFVDMAKNMVGESVKSILALKDLFMGLLAKAAAAFTMILDKPLQFITNFMSAVKQGFLNFADHILEHLKKGLQGWLFGQLASAGVELPEKFDLMGILKMVASLLGLTWDGIKARIAAKDPFVGTVIDQIQSKIEIFVVLATKGIVGIWDWIKEKVGDLKQLVFDQIKSFIIEKIVKAGITWVLGMLNPAGALIKIVQALISVVQWIMERGAEMGEFIRTIIDAVMDIARGGGGGVPAKIEAALGKAVPLVISFLAGLLGLGGISEKVKSIIEKGQNLVGKAVDWVVGKALKMARPLINAMKKGAGWVKGKVAAGKAWVKGKYEAGKGWVKKKYEGAKSFVKGKLGMKDDKGQGDKAPAPNVKAERPDVSVGFEMAGESHQLKFDASPDGVQISMASQELPLTAKFRQAHTAIDNFKHHMSTVTDPVVKERYEKELAPKLASFPAARVDDFRRLYEAYFPPGAAPSPLRPEQRKSASANVEKLVTATHQLLAEIKAWGATTGISDLSEAKISATLQNKGNEIWKQAHALIRERITRVIAGFDYKGTLLGFVGSAQTGWRGPHKATTHFDASNFDVDLYVVHPEDYDRIANKKPELVMAGKIFPGYYSADLQTLSTRVAAALAAEFPNVARIGRSNVVLRRMPPR
jgi:hypothetical protein